MIEPTNAIRAEWARTTLAVFCSLTRCDPDTSAADLICNIGHLIDEDKTFGDHLQQVCNHGIGMYDEEKAEERELRDDK